MRILFLLTQDLESPSGLGRYWPLARALAAHGHQVRIATLHSNWANLTSKKFTREGVTVDYVAPMHVMKSGNQKKYYDPLLLLFIALRATWALFKAALSARVDIVHLGKPHPMNSIAGVLASRLNRSILCLDCDDYEAESNRFGKQWQQNVVAYFEIKIPTIARLVTTNTQFMKSKLIEWDCPAERIFYLPNGIDRERFQEIKQDEVDKLRTRFGLSGKHIVLYLGSLSLISHPVDLLLKAFKIITQELSNVSLLVVGGGEDYLKLIDQAKTLGINQYSHFTGKIESTDVPIYYAIGDVSVDPVYDDDVARGRSPLKLFESWACGVPFVTSPVGDRQYLLGQPSAGMLVEPAGDPNALADGILHILKSNELAMELRRRGLGRVQQYTWDRLAVQLEHEYQRLL
jgi:glycosyltransferase involved in cell wall biosynthesis